MKKAKAKNKTNKLKTHQQGTNANDTFGAFFDIITTIDTFISNVCFGVFFAAHIHAQIT